jgi:ubiquitin-like modifier-activating enzyme ATG7
MKNCNQAVVTSRLARDAVDLNIKLMKWRMLPHIDLELIKNTKCLLFGAGTLGCQLARNLIGWGVRNITFVDYGKVSYSNPVRQTLFDYEDSINGGRPKAEVAAEKLKKIFPDIESKGYHIEIPMPGHYIGESQVLELLVFQVERIVESLNICDQLVEQHDAVFLLTDSREARWLPTLLANKHKKMSFAVALGFDSFLIIRQGISVLSYDPQVHGERLSCYFCNDIAAPQDSMKDRTLDQQCTVTRPGLSFLAAAYSSELLVSLL